MIVAVTLTAGFYALCLFCALVPRPKVQLVRVHEDLGEPCAHGCGADATLTHADGRGLCARCYSAEVTGRSTTGDCPTCGEES